MLSMTSAAGTGGDPVWAPAGRVRSSVGTSVTSNAYSRQGGPEQAGAAAGRRDERPLRTNANAPRAAPRAYWKSVPRAFRRPSVDPLRESPFDSFFMGGFDCATQRRRDGARVDSLI